MNDESTAAYLARARAILPDVEFGQVEVNNEGLANTVFIVNGSLVVRFARSEAYAHILQREIAILDAVRPRTRLRLPAPVYQAADCVVYPYLAGQPFTRKTLLGLDADSRAACAEALGQFLAVLHSTSLDRLAAEIPATPAPVRREDWLEIRERARRKVYPLLLRYQVEWAEDLFASALERDEFFDYPPALIHGDLACYHILFDPRSARLSGVIDFGVAGTGDPALDLGSLMTTYGEPFTAALGSSYPGLAALLPRARFYAQSIELQWVLLGIESGETFWYTAHLGGARDMRG